MGNQLMGMETGLDAALKRCNTHSDVKSGLPPDMLHSLLAFLAILSKELGNEERAFTQMHGHDMKMRSDDIKSHTISKKSSSREVFSSRFDCFPSISALLDALEDGAYLVAGTPGPVNEAWLEKIQNQNQAWGLGSLRPLRVSAFEVVSIPRAPLESFHIKSKHIYKI